MSFYISPAVNYSEVSHKREGAIFSCMLVINVEFGLSKIRKKQDRRYSDPKACNCKKIIGQKIRQKIGIQGTPWNLKDTKVTSST